MLAPAMRAYDIDMKEFIMQTQIRSSLAAILFAVSAVHDSAVGGR